MFPERRPTAESVIDDEDGPTTDADEPRTRALVVGLIGGVVATVVMSAFRIPISRSPPPTAWFWARFLGDGEPEEYVGRGLLLHLLYGTAAGGVFGALIGPHLSGDEATRERRATLLGAVYGVVLSLFGVSVLLERVLGLDLDPDERFVFHVSHLVYGLTLGTWFGSNN
ncbi:hypothetical protein HUG10_18825 (plasmid) [Halorarum halophilum]|uniref:DUF1440 domain-containing protein n=1 Tax=Halorarum halophilum TaxID=2743090 RepID=A0A7D5L317_9EURY|nr:hypothetical protein [Halobaculum halophilum]QLG29663.1 hypothetical protein HUG10_18825 [Halobaculum halophilum]